MKRIMSIVITGLILFSFSNFITPTSTVHAESYFVGSGTKDTPYQISSESDLRLLSELVSTNNSYRSAYYVQTTDIILTQTFTPISYDNEHAFTGSYNGNYCSISDLSVDTEYIHSGLFGTIQSATIENLSVYGNISSKSTDDSSTTGGIVGIMSEDSVITKCSFNGNVSSVSNNVGGIVGKIGCGGSLLSNYSNAIISGNNNIGGLIGCLADDNMKSSYTLSHNYVVGSVDAISNTDSVGSVIGNVISSNEETIINTDVNLYLYTVCSAGAVHSSSYHGCTKVSEGALKAWFDELGSPFIENKETNGFNDGYPIFEWQSTPYAFIGDGTANNPYQISSKEELEIMRNLINSPYSCGKYNGCYYIQTDDIDLQGTEWEPIGKRYLNGSEALLSFNGNYNGQGHEITNLYVNRKEKYAGLFGSLNGNKFIENLVVFGSVKSTSDSVGGICGEICDGGGTIRNCTFYGDLETSGKAIGGIAGCLWQSGNVENCYHNGTVTGIKDVGGIVGQVTVGYDKEENASINNCYHVGKINGSSNSSGGIVGLCGQSDSYPANIYLNNCYYLNDSAVSGYNGVCSVGSVSELTPNLMKNVAADLGAMFKTNTNANYNDGYPLLVFQTSDGLLGDANLDGSVNVADVVMLQKWLLGSGVLTCWKNVNFYDDDRIDVFDLCLMKRYLLNLGGTSSGIPASIKLNSSSYTMAVGQTYQLTSTVIPETEANAKVTWASSNTAIVSVDDNGSIKALSPGTATITAKTLNGNKQASCTVTVLTPSIKLNSTNKSLYINDTATLTATVAPEGSIVKWESSDSKIVTVDNGKIKAVSSGDATITATITVGGTDYSAFCKVNVAKAYVTLDKSSLSMYIGDAYTFTLKVSPSGTKLTWKSSNTSVATVNENGKVTAVSNGSATITASFVYNGETIKATCSVTVKKPTVKINSNSGSMYPGDTKNLTASVDPSGSSVTWSSSNTSVATVSGGTISAKSGGSATITASITYAGKTYSDTCFISVSGLSLSLSSNSGSGSFDVYDAGFYQDGTVAFSISLPSASYSPSGGSTSWSVVGGSGRISGSKLLITQPGTVTARCTLTYKGYSTYRDYTYSLSTYKTTGGNNNIRSGPGGGYSYLGTVPANTTVSLYELSMNGDLNSGSLWGRVNYNGIEGWIIISEW